GGLTCWSSSNPGVRRRERDCKLQIANCKLQIDGRWIALGGGGAIPRRALGTGWATAGRVAGSGIGTGGQAWAEPHSLSGHACGVELLREKMPAGGAARVATRTDSEAQSPHRI